MSLNGKDYKTAFLRWDGGAVKMIGRFLHLNFVPVSQSLRVIQEKKPGIKKIVLFTALLMLILGLTACSKEEKFLNADKVTVNTILAKANGALQVATVEAFDKSYYNLNELQEFVAKEIDTYSQKAGKDKVVINDIRKSGDKAIMLLTYSGMDQYSTFNDVAAAYFNGGSADVSALNLPATLVNAKNDSLVSTQEIIQNSGYKILVLNEPYEIVVDGKVKYYSDNAKLLENDKVQGAAEGMTVVVFR